MDQMDAGVCEFTKVTLRNGNIVSIYIASVGMHVIIEKLTEGVWAEHIHFINPTREQSQYVNRLLGQPEIFRIKEINLAR